MEPLARELLSAALRVMWEHGHSEDQRAVELIAQRVPGFSAEQCEAASRRAAELNRTAYELAAAWFASMGKSELYPTVEELEERCPGFCGGDYVEAISKNILWARM